MMSQQTNTPVTQNAALNGKRKSHLMAPKLMCGLIQGLSVTTAILQRIYLIIYHVLWIKVIIRRKQEE